VNGGEAQSHGQGSAWLRPQLDDPDLRRYVATLRERLWLIVVVTLLTTAAAVAYVGLSSKTYTASADLVISPVSTGDSALAALPLLRESTDPTRVVQTAARLVTTTDVAQSVKRRLRLKRSSRSLLGSVDAQPVAQSNVVALSAKAGNPKAAARLANAFALAVIANRTDEFHRQLDKALALARSARNSGGLSVDPARVTELYAARAGPVPDMRVSKLADPPTSPSSPKARLSIVVGGLAGLVLAIGGAFALQALDPRLRSDDQLRRLFALPILARIPHERRGKSRLPRRPEELSLGGRESFRTLRATLAASGNHRGGARSVLVTSASPGEGKTTAVINLAALLALTGARVIVVEADLRRPAIGKTLQLSPVHEMGAVLTETVSLDEALVTSEAYGPNLRFLVANPVPEAGTSAADWLFLPATQELLAEAKRMADYVVIDSPPLTEVIDALPIAQRADDVLLVVRMRQTHLARLRRLGELLARYEIRPVGLLVVGAAGAETGTRYPYQSEASEPAGVVGVTQQR
jgi:Mrp family chromosome partitioning ATPase/capsular polysaccharide biosynthesis protein